MLINLSKIYVLNVNKFYKIKVSNVLSKALSFMNPQLTQLI